MILSKNLLRTQVIVKVCSLINSLIDTIMDDLIDTIMNDDVPSLRQMCAILREAREFPSNYSSPSQLAMLDKYAYLTGEKEVLDPNYHSPSQIEDLRCKKSKNNKQNR